MLAETACLVLRLPPCSNYSAAYRFSDLLEKCFQDTYPSVNDAAFQSMDAALWSQSLSRHSLCKVASGLCSSTPSVLFMSPEKHFAPPPASQV